MNKRGCLLVVSGPSGCGKGTVLAELLKSDDNIFYSVSATTRRPREGEIDGVHYYFISHEEFEKHIKNKDMLEYACYVGNYYGTPRLAVEKQLAMGHDVVLEIEVQGALQIKESCPEAILIFMVPPTLAELRRRLVNRKTETEAVINNRMDAAKREISSAHLYDYIIVNDTIEEALEKLKSIIAAEKSRVCQMKTILDEVIKHA